MGLGAAIGAVLAPAIGLALSPFAVIAVILIMMSANDSRTGPAFAVGWIAGLAVATAIIVAVADTVSLPDRSGPIGWLLVALGLLFLLMAVAAWRRRPGPGKQPKPPDWMGAVDTMQPVTAAGMGVLLSAGNLKNLSLAAGAALSIAQHDLGVGRAAAAVVVLVLIGSVTVAGPVVALLVWPDAAERHLLPVKDWFTREHATVVFVVLLLIGVVLFGRGIEAVS